MCGFVRDKTIFCDCKHDFILHSSRLPPANLMALLQILEKLITYIIKLILHFIKLNLHLGFGLSWQSCKGLVGLFGGCG